MSLAREPFENERRMLLKVQQNLGEIPDAELADAAQLAGEMAEFYTVFNKNCQRELMTRMHASERSILVAGDWRCERVAQPVYEYVDGGKATHRVLSELFGEAEADRYVQYIPPKPVEGVWKVNTQALKALLNKVSPEEAERLRATFNVLEKNPKVVFERSGGAK